MQRDVAFGEKCEERDNKEWHNFSEETINISVDLDLIAQGVRMILEGIGEDPERAGLQETPQRSLRCMQS